MDFSTNKLPSSMQEIDWHWRQYIQEYFDLSQININGSTVDFNLPSDYFELTDDVADKLSLIGRKYSFFSQPVSMTDVELSIFGNISADMQWTGAFFKGERNRILATANYVISKSFIFTHCNFSCKA